MILTASNQKMLFVLLVQMGIILHHQVIVLRSILCAKQVIQLQVLALTAIVVILLPLLLASWLRLSIYLTARLLWVLAVLFVLVVTLLKMEAVLLQMSYVLLTILRMAPAGVVFLAMFSKMEDVSFQHWALIISAKFTILTVSVLNVLLVTH